MEPKRHLLTLLFVVIVMSAAISHGIASWLKIDTTPGDYWVLGPGNGSSSIFMAGSSLAGDAIAWDQVADQLNVRIEGRGGPGFSPSEWEQYQKLEAHALRTILVVSPYDLNEYYLSDHFAKVVPLGQTLADLSTSSMDWASMKRVISTYPLAYTRTLFPTAGRSNGVIRGIREEAEILMRAMNPSTAEKYSSSGFTDPVASDEIKRVSIVNWSSNIRLRRIVGMRIACEGKHGYNGLRKLAFLRMLRRAEQQGGVVVVVLPVSPLYATQFLPSDVRSEFEAALIEAQKAVPDALWIRLDEVPELNADENFYDLVHMNPAGRAIATKVFMARFQAAADPS